MVEKTVLLFVIFGHSLKSPPFKTFDLLAEDFHVCFVFFSSGTEFLIGWGRKMWKQSIIFFCFSVFQLLLKKLLELKVRNDVEFLPDGTENN